jgi:phosphoglycerate kinase
LLFLQKLHMPDFVRMSDLDLAGRRVLIRQDLNVPIKDGRISNDARLRASIATIKAAVQARARVMLLSHLGRPTEGQPQAQFSLEPVADRFQALLGRPVGFANHWLDGLNIADGGSCSVRTCVSMSEKRLTTMR